MGSGTSLLAAKLMKRFVCSGVVWESALAMRAGSPLHMFPMDAYPTLEHYRAAADMPCGLVEMARKDHEQLYNTVAANRGRHVVDKAPNVSLLRADFLAECFPTAPFIVIFRDPAANIEGFRRKWPLCRHASLEANIDFYEWLHARILASSAEQSGRVHWVEYERLVANPIECVAELATIVGAPRRDRPRGVSYVADRLGRGLRAESRGSVTLIEATSLEARARLELSERQLIDNRLGRLRIELLERAESSRVRARQTHPPDKGAP